MEMKFMCWPFRISLTHKHIFTHTNTQLYQKNIHTIITNRQSFKKIKKPNIHTHNHKNNHKEQKKANNVKYAHIYTNAHK